MSSKRSCQHTSEVRSFFSFLERENINVCKIAGCKRTFKGNHAGNMQKHLKSCHPDEHLEVERRRKNRVPPTTLPDQISVSKKRILLQVSIDKDEIKDACVEMVTVNGRPLVAVEDSGFRKILDPVLNAVNRHSDQLLTINRRTVRDFVHEKSNNIKSKIKEELKGKLIALKLDCATRLHRSILGINVQLIRKGKIAVRTLAMVELTEKHTGDFLCSKIIEVLNNYNVDAASVYSITTDNGANMIKAVHALKDAVQQEEVIRDGLHSLTNVEEGDDEETFQEIVEECMISMTQYSANNFHAQIWSFRCAAHTLQLAINDSLKNKQQCLQSIRDFVRKLRTPSLINALKRNNISLPTLDCVTRWLSTYYMLENLIKFRDAYAAIPQEEHGLHFYKIQWEEVKEMAEALAPAARAMKTFQLQQLTLTDCYMEWLKCKHETNKCKTSLATTIVERMSEREKKIRNSDVMKAALYLDPRLQAVLTESERDDAKNHLKKLWNCLQALQQDESSSQSSDTANREDENHSEEQDEFAKYLLDLSCSISEDRQSRGTVNIAASLENFSNYPRLEHQASILDFWEKKKEEQSELYCLSQVVFSVPATQVSVERAFSSLKFILSDYRENLTDEILEDILVIRLNSSLND